MAALQHFLPGSAAAERVQQLRWRSGEAPVKLRWAGPCGGTRDDPGKRTRSPETTVCTQPCFPDFSCAEYCSWWVPPPGRGQRDWRRAGTTPAPIGPERHRDREGAGPEGVPAHIPPLLTHTRAHAHRNYMVTLLLWRNIAILYII